MNKLSMQEIRDAFPDEIEEIVPRLQKSLGAYKKFIENLYTLVYSSPKLDEWSRKFYCLVIRIVFLDPAEKEQSRLSRYLVMKSSSNQCDVERAKLVDIEQLFEPRKAHRGSKRIHCCCPIHDEKTASFVIYKENNSFYCFGCHAGGDVINFVQKLHGFNFVEAVKYLENFHTSPHQGKSRKT